MKKVLFASAAILLSFMSIQAQTDNNVTANDKNASKEERKEKRHDRITLRVLEGKDVSYQSKEQFYSDFGNHPEAAWKKTNYFDEATFTNNGISMLAFYDYDSKLVGTTCMKTFADLPASAQKEISRDYKDYSIQGIVFYDDNETNDTDMMLFGNLFDDEDNYFVVLQKDNKNIILQVTTDGLVGYFTTL